MTIERGLIAKANEQLENMASYLKTPIATYTHNANKSNAVSAIDLSTNRFTSDAHTFIDGEIVFPVMNLGAGSIYPLAVYPAGLVYSTTGYYVKKIDANTFELYSDAGLTAIVDITGASSDLTKWHFEKEPGDITISNLPSLSKCRIVVTGRILKKTLSPYIMPNSLYAFEQAYLKSGSTAYTYNSIVGCFGDLSVNVEVIIDYSKYLKCKTYGSIVYSASASTVTTAIIEQITRTFSYKEGLITSLAIKGWDFANGTIVEVYSA